MTKVLTNYIMKHEKIYISIIIIYNLSRFGYNLILSTIHVIKRTLQVYL